MQKIVRCCNHCGKLDNPDKDIIDKLNEIALEMPWGVVERVNNDISPNGMPKAVAVIQEAISEIKRLRAGQVQHNILDFNMIKRIFNDWGLAVFEKGTPLPNGYTEIKIENLFEGFRLDK